MQVCPNCRFDNMEGILFCNRCGYALENITISTKKLGENESEDNFAAGSHYLSDEGVIMLHFKTQQEPLPLRILSSTVLGREDLPEEAEAFVSLEPFGASSLGVSRKHAQLTRQNYELFLRDLNSTNHTFLNGQQITSGRDYAVRDGDEIALGKLTFRLFFK